MPAASVKASGTLVSSRLSHNGGRPAGTVSMTYRSQVQKILALAAGARAGGRGGAAQNRRVDIARPLSARAPLSPSQPARVRLGSQVSNSRPRPGLKMAPRTGQILAPRGATFELKRGALSKPPFESLPPARTSKCGAPGDHSLAGQKGGFLLGPLLPATICRSLRRDTAVLCAGCSSDLQRTGNFAHQPLRQRPACALLPAPPPP